MIAIQHTVKDLEVKTGLQNLSERLSKPEQALKECGLVLIRSISKNFEEGGRPKKWKKSIRGGQTLVKTARLKNSISYEVDGSTLRVGTNVLYGTIQQLGGTIVPKKAKALKIKFPDGSWRIVKKVVIPPRPYLLIQDEDYKVFTKIFEDYLAQK